MEKEKLVLYPLAAYGIARGAVNVYIKSAVSTVLEKTVGRLTFTLVDMDSINEYMQEILADEQEQFGE